MTSTASGLAGGINWEQEYIAAPPAATGSTTLMAMLVVVTVLPDGRAVIG